MAVQLAGIPAVRALREELALRAKRVKVCGVVPTLAIVRVGAREDDVSYERSAIKSCEAVGVRVKQFTLDAGATQETLLETIDTINQDPEIQGCLLFRPLPEQMEDQTVCAALDPAKDVDGITAGSLAGIFLGHKTGFPPCTAQACVELLDHYGYKLAGRRVVVIGRSLVVGRPLAMLLLHRNATVTICHSKTEGLAAICRQAEVLVAAAGKAGLVDASFVSPGQIVLDVGIHGDGHGGLCGDVAFDQVEPIVDAITPVPSGVGSMTSAILVRHVMEAAERTCGLWQG
ncbi:MAG: bifunctional 5,10-methylenetetrahydrofolate dehydrogenase/5,10-methenyltetrahydrofolate cyclohydrolase [Oscillospiraceae bacterium]|nr:bifunctional 5,10-methylenetetrahydrofolate dehydrogenase/5,10-methenyltetrahydrofolate cyclohydrolase [Oscillospiraceae bacterium]